MTSKTLTDAPDLTAGIRLSEVVLQVRKPAGFAALNNEQRKFLLAALLASVVPVDGKIKPCEMDKLNDLLSGRMQTKGKTLAEALTIARSNLGTQENYTVVAAHLPELLSIDDRCSMIGMLWDLALCDHELHATEEKLIYTIADKAEVPRKTVAEQLARSSANVV